MAFRFRLCFQVPETSSFTGDGEFVEFVVGADEHFKLTAIDRDKKLQSSRRFVLGGGPYATAEQAATAGSAARTALLYYATTNRVGVDLGKYEPRGGLTEAGRQFFSAQAGAPVLDDRLGLTVFSTEPPPRFIRINPTLQVGKSTQSFIDVIRSVYPRYTLGSPRAEVAIELLAMSHFESAAGARFLSAYMAVETVLDPIPRPDEACQHIDRLIEMTQGAGLPNNIRDSLLGPLGRLKVQSIAQTGRQFADAILAQQQYSSMSPGDFFGKIYRMRNDLVHRGVADREELIRILPDLERFASDVLRHQFAAT